MTRACCTGSVVTALLLCTTAAGAQETVETRSDGTVVIDILVPVPTTDEADASRQCPAAPASGANGPEIVVCGEPVDDTPYYYSGSAEAAEDRYAQETAFAGEIRGPDVAGPGIFTGPASVSGLCGFIFNPCPPPEALVIDVAALPPAPPGSDADRIARGLEPLGEDDQDNRTLTEEQRAELGLPLPPLD